MTKRSPYDQGRLDAISEIFVAGKKGKDIHEKIENMFDKTILILQKMNNIHVKGVAKK